MRYNRRKSVRNPGRAPHPHIGLHILLLVIELYKGGEHACDLLIVSVSMSIQNYKKLGSTPITY